MDNINIKLNENTKYEITATIQKCGEDLVVSVFGGEKPHIGAVALSVGHIDGYDLKYSPTVNSISVLDHKDDEIARMLAKNIAKFTRVQVVVTVGIHIEKATSEEIKKIANDIEVLQNKIFENLN